MVKGKVYFAAIWANQPAGGTQTFIKQTLWSDNECGDFVGCTLGDFRSDEAPVMQIWLSLADPGIDSPSFSLQVLIS